MKLLICAQVMDRNDPGLGFIHRWVEEFAKEYERVTVICLREGEHSLPANVRVLSLGKEGGKSRLKYLTRFYSYIWRERRNYDAVLVHMNQEYVILGWKMWKLLGKRIYMWRNHYAGSFLTDIAAFFCTKVFCTSKYSYTAKYKKTILMPVGVDTLRFKEIEGITRASHSILSLGRISPSKNLHLLVSALGLLHEQGVQFEANVYGDALPQDAAYLEGLRADVAQLGLSDAVHFHAGIPNTDTPSVYSAAEIFVNVSPQGMFDKTILESAACGCLTLTANKDAAHYLPQELILSETSPEALAAALVALLNGSVDTATLYEKERELVSHHTLAALAQRLKEEI